MDIDLIIKIAGVGILTGIIHTILVKFDKSEFAYITTLVGIIVVLGMAISLVGRLFNDIRIIFRL